MQQFKLEDISPSRKGKHYRTLCFEISTPNCYFTQESLALDQFIQRLSMGEINFDWLITFFTVIKDWLYDIFIITRKNLRIRRRRYMAFILEMFAPIMIVSFLVKSSLLCTFLWAYYKAFLNLYHSLNFYVFKTIYRLGQIKLHQSSAPNRNFWNHIHCWYQGKDWYVGRVLRSWWPLRCKLFYYAV